jgi:membrane associated rhomboid family serine protease
MILPYCVEVLHPQKPHANYTIIGICSLFFAIIMLNRGIPLFMESMILDGWNPVGILGCAFLHGGFFHFLFNMIYLWVFGNAICSKLGNWKYVVLFASCTTVASVFHNLVDGTAAVGASGAINGVIGFYLALYPMNKIHCAYFLLFRSGSFRISGKWLIGFWFILDVWGAYSGPSNVGYWAHIGGFVSGLLFGLVCLDNKWILMDRVDHPTLLDAIRKRKVRPGRDRNKA